MLTYPTLVRVIPFAVYILLLAFNGVLAELLSHVLPQAQWLYGVRVGLVAILLAVFWKHYRELSIGQSAGSVSYLLSIILGVAVFAIWILPYPSWAMTRDQSGFEPISQSAKELNYTLVAMRLSGAALVVPIMEELFWRSFLMRWLQNQDFLQVNPRAVGAFAFLSTAGLFAVEHHLWLAGLIAGLVYGWLYWWKEDLWLPIVAHMVTNGMLGGWVLYTGNWQYW